MSLSASHWASVHLQVSLSPYRSISTYKGSSYIRQKVALFNLINANLQNQMEAFSDGMIFSILMLTGATVCLNPLVSVLLLRTIVQRNLAAQLALSDFLCSNCLR